MSKTVIQLLAVAWTLDILTAQFVFEYDYDFHHNLSVPEERSESNHLLQPEGRSGNKWLGSGRCGPRFRLSNGNPAICNPYSTKNACCNIVTGYCGSFFGGSSFGYCGCRNCIDYTSYGPINSVNTHVTYPPTGGRNYIEYEAHFADRQCPQIRLFENKDFNWCRKECDRTVGCTAFNFAYDTNSCSLKTCGLDPPYPIAYGDQQKSYTLKSIAKNFTRYSGPQDKYYSRSHGCIHIHPTRHSKSYVECEEICDQTAFCIGFNFNLNTFNCEMFYCDHPKIQPKGVREQNWESWAKKKFIDGYNGPASDRKYYTASQGCVRILPNPGNIPKAECEKLCDENSYCIGFNQQYKSLYCQLFYCKDPTTTPQENYYPNWRSYSKMNFIQPVPRLYIELEKSRDQSHLNDTSCWIIEHYSTPESLEECEHLCDVQHSQCKGFYYNPNVVVGEVRCILQTCRHKSPLSKVQGSGWQAYVVQRQHVQGWSILNTACVWGGQFSMKVGYEIQWCQEYCRELGAACKSISYEASTKKCKLSPHDSTSDHYTYPCRYNGYLFTEIVGSGRKTRPYYFRPRSEGKSYSNKQCDVLSSHESDLTITNCKTLCDLKAKCTAFNFKTGKGCVLRACGQDPPYPIGEEEGWQGYYFEESMLEETKRNVNRNYSEHIGKYFLNWQCPLLRRYSGHGDRRFDIRHCQGLCDSVFNCTGVNYGFKLRCLSPFCLRYHPPEQCLLYACGNSLPKPHGSQTDLLRFQSYSIKKDAVERYDGPHESYYTANNGKCVRLETTYSDITYEECAEHCDIEQYCVGFNLDLETGNCELWHCFIEGTNNWGDDESDIRSWRKRNYRNREPDSYIILPYSEGLSFSNRQCRVIIKYGPDISLTKCKTLCDLKAKCTAFNFHRHGECVLRACGQHPPHPIGQTLHWQGYVLEETKRKEWIPRSYIILSGSEGKSYTNEQCDVLSELESDLTITNCKRLCDLKPKCTAFNFHRHDGCVLRACGQQPPHPIGEEEGWQGYASEETERNNGISWYYGPYAGTFFGEKCDQIKRLTNKMPLVDCEEACDNEPWCTGFNYDDQGQESGPICNLVACDSRKTPPQTHQEAESWSKYKISDPEFEKRCPYPYYCQPAKTGKLCGLTCFYSGGNI